MSSTEFTDLGSGEEGLVSQRQHGTKMGVSAFKYMKIQTWTLASIFVAVLIGVIAFMVIEINKIHPSRNCPGNPRGEAVYYEHPTVVLQNVTIISGGKYLYTQNVLLRNGKIAEISSGALSGDKTYDASGNYLTAGLVDMHSHSGVYSFPEIWATEDGNEMTNPTFPQARALDGFDPEDLAIPQILSGGVTSAQILPGSGNTMGGEGFQVKFGGPTRFADAQGPPFMYLEDQRIMDGPRAMKMACGENPKRVYGRKGVTPMSRMGSAWVMRQKFEAAQKLLLEQDDWCNGKIDGERMPTDLSLDSLVSLLRGHVNLNVHCYQVHDLQMMMRLAKEFGFKISAFHHALEAYKIPEVIKESDITVATFSDLWGYKYEAYDASVASPRVLEESGVKVALKTDHPVLFARDLIEEAAKAHAYGLSEHGAINAVTSVPANSIGVGHRLGVVETEKDADVVVWDRHPLAIGARPSLVFVEGLEVFRRDSSVKQSNSLVSPKPNTLLNQQAKMTITRGSDGAGECTPSSNYAITGVFVADGTNPPSAGSITVTNGVVSCVGASCTPPTGATVIDFGGLGYAVPGMIEVGTPVGLVEISSESSTRDGYADGIDNRDIFAKDGIMMGSRHLNAAWNGGVSIAVTPPQGVATLSGVSTAFATGGGSFTTSVIQPETALHINVGHNAKSSGQTGAISGQIAVLRAKFHAALSSPYFPANTTDPVVRAVNGALPVLAHTQQADHIRALITMFKSEFPRVKLIIIGGAEGHLVASELKANAVPIILSPARCVPEDTWPAKRCVENNLEILNAAGVDVMVARGDVDNVRNLRWEVGVLRAQSSRIPWTDALATVTSRIARNFNLPHGGRIEQGRQALITVYSSDPFTYSSRVLLSTLRQSLTCRPKQFGEERTGQKDRPLRTQAKA